MTKIKMHVLCCGGTGCQASASAQIVKNFETILAEKGLQDEVQVIKTGCFGFCEKGPIVKIMPDNTFYVQVKPEDVEKIVNEHIIKGRKVTDLLYLDPENQEHVADSKHMGFTVSSSVSLCVTAVSSILKTSTNAFHVAVTKVSASA